MAFMDLTKYARVSVLCLLFLSLFFTGIVQGQTCLTHGDIDEPTRSALESAAKRYFDMAAGGDTGGLKQNAIPSLAANFSGVELAVTDSKASLAGTQAHPRPPFLLKVEGTKPLERAEFLCGVFSKNGQTANSAAFVIPNLAPGNYGMVTLDVSGTEKAQTVSFVLQQQGPDWKLAGFYVHASQVVGHDADWFAEKAQAFKTKGQSRNAWLYYLEARELAVPVPFMYTQTTDKLYDESHALKPTDLPADGTTADLLAGGKTCKMTAMFPVAVGDELDVVVKYQAADVSHTSETFKDNMAVIHALVSKYPELRDAFGGVVARAVEPSGRDYGSMLPMKEIK